MLHYLYFLDKKLVLESGRTYTIGREAHNHLVLPDRSVSRSHATVAMTPEGPVLEDMNSTNGTTVNYQATGRRLLRSGDRITIGPFVLIYRSALNSVRDTELEGILGETLMIENGISRILDEIKDAEVREKVLDIKRLFNRSRERLHDMANRDRLTGLYNRRFFDEAVRSEVERARRYGHALSLVMCDIDRFKSVNDTHGHQKGDEVLAFVGGLIEAATRFNDVAARYGGEEMVLLLPEVGSEQAVLAAGRIRTAVERKSGPEVGIGVTISMGVAGCDPSCSSTELIERADEALYEAKRGGRNRVVHYLSSSMV